MTWEEIKELLEKALEKSKIQEDGDPIARKMDEAWNRGVKHMFNTAIIAVCEEQLRREGMSA